MTKARAIADLLDANNDVQSANLDNVDTNLVADTSPQFGGDLDGIHRERADHDRLIRRHQP